MTNAQEKLMARLAALDIKTTAYEHEAVFTVAESNEITIDMPGGHTKNLFLKDKKGAYWLVVALQDTAVSLKTLHTIIGSARLSFAQPDRLRQVLDVEPGSVTPFALINDTENIVNVVLDDAMMTQDLLNFHPLRNTATNSIEPADLLRFINSCGHQPQICACGSAA